MSYIKREAAIGSLMEILDRPKHAEFLYTDEICGALQSIPAADVRPVNDLVEMIDKAIEATDMNDAYSIGLRNGLRCAKSFIDGEEPEYEKVSADVRPVVFCKDCDLWNEWDSSGKESLGNFRCSCAYWSSEDGPIHYTAKTDFCSYGEKKEET